MSNYGYRYQQVKYANKIVEPKLREMGARNYAFRTSDGRLFETLSEALVHARRNRLKLYFKGGTSPIIYEKVIWTDIPRWRGKRSY